RRVVRGGIERGSRRRGQRHPRAGDRGLALKSRSVRDRTLHSMLEAFTADAAAQLTAETQDGAEIPFEVIDTGGRPGTVPLYCYRPLTTDFIGQRLGVLSGLPTYAPAARELAGLDRIADYLSQRGEPRAPDDPRQC